MEELNTMKQNINESVASYYERLDKLCAKIYSAMPYKTKDELDAKIETIKELTLTRFVHHSSPEISRFLRSQNLDDISVALTKAIEGKPALRISNAEFKTNRSAIKHCNICKRKGHPNQ